MIVSLSGQEEKQRREGREGSSAGGEKQLAASGGFGGNCGDWHSDGGGWLVVIGRIKKKEDFWGIMILGVLGERKREV